MKMQNRKALFLFTLSWILTCVENVKAHAMVMPVQTSKGLRRQTVSVDQQEDLPSEMLQMDEPSEDVEANRDKQRRKKSPYEVLGK